MTIEVLSIASNTSFKIPNSFITKLDLLVYAGIFESRGEAIRTAIQEYIEENFSVIFLEKNIPIRKH